MVQVPTTIGGIGRPMGATSNQFTDIRKFFEGKTSSDKPDSSGEESETVRERKRERINHYYSNNNPNN